jgi:hypothetical protein
MSFVASSQKTGEAVEALTLHRFLMRLTHAGLAGFLWVFVFQYLTLFFSLTQALVQTFLLYALMQTVALLAMPFMMYVMREGMRRGMVYATLLLAIVLVYSGLLFSGFIFYSIALIGILLGFERALYRVPYAVEKSAIGTLGKPEMVCELLLVCTPATVGLILSTGIVPCVLLCGLAILPILALAPLIRVPNIYEHFSWNYRDTFGHLMAPAHRPLLLASMRRGALSALLFLVWPLLLMFASPSYLALGAAFSITLLIIFLFRASQRRARIEYHADGSAYIDEYTALKEMGIALGQLTVALACAIALSAGLF